MTILLKSSWLLLCFPETGDIPSLEWLFCDAGMIPYLGAPWHVHGMIVMGEFDGKLVSVSERIVDNAKRRSCSAL